MHRVDLRKSVTVAVKLNGIFEPGLLKQNSSGWVLELFITAFSVWIRKRGAVGGRKQTPVSVSSCSSASEAHASSAFGICDPSCLQRRQSSALLFPKYRAYLRHAPSLAIVDGRVPSLSAFHAGVLRHQGFHSSMDSVQYNPLNPSLHLSRGTIPLNARARYSEAHIDRPPCPFGDPSPRHAPDSDPLASPTVSGMNTVTFRSEPSETIINIRHYAAQDLATCRKIIVMLELTRMRKARKGIGHWILFWRQIYDPGLAQAMTRAVTLVFLEVEQLFRTMAQQMCFITRNVGKRMAHLRTIHEARTIWRQLEQQIIWFRKIRRSRAQILFDKLRRGLENIPVDVPDHLFDDVKRGIFALDPFGDYHPGDSMAEEWDKHAVGKEYAEVYLRQQQDLPSRPGFNGEFQGALHAASTGLDWFSNDVGMT
ncbi:hypothetical protein CIHG_07655 [Coccidioides immitis H538.4]|uniref:Uncharacterized protein n=1 Tax=Coccidioides immitis H538.4 TaxID=396776 RepID=A0A0J8RYW2_COCIT|nr:hypothetical protein CIHG_07655 [Coccidioides immitis H538.4]